MHLFCIICITFIFNFITLRAIGSPDIVSSNTHPRYVACDCCFTFIWLYLIFSWRTLFDLHLHKKRIDLVLSSPKCILYYPQVTDISKAFLSCFSISYTSLFWYKMHESSEYKSKLIVFSFISLSISLYILYFILFLCRYVFFT